MQSFKFIKRWLCLALCLVLCLSMLPGQAQAIDPIDLEAKTSLSMVFQPEERVAKNVTFQIYRVGEPDRFCNFTKTEAFAAYDVAASTIFKSACWTPSPETSRVMEVFSLLRAILSTSSM